MKKFIVLIPLAVLLFVGYRISHPQASKQTSIASSDSQTADNYYSVTHVVDGDTIEVDINGQTERVRLIGINTPETVDPRKPVQCFGREASNAAKQILNDQQVKLESDQTQSDRDKYHRLLRYVILPDGTNFNLYMIKAGYAFEYTYADNPYKYQAEFQNAEDDARENNRGLWSPSACNGQLKPAN